MRGSGRLTRTAENLHSHTVDGPPSLPTVHRGNKRWPRRGFSARGGRRREDEGVWSGADEAQRGPGSGRRRGLPATYAIVGAQPGVRLGGGGGADPGTGGGARGAGCASR